MLNKNILKGKISVCKRLTKNEENMPKKSSWDWTKRFPPWKSLCLPSQAEAKRPPVHTEAEKRRGRQRRPLNVQNTASMNVYSLYRGFNVVVRDLSIPALTP